MIALDYNGKYVVLRPEFDLVGRNLEKIRNTIFDLGARGSYWVCLNLDHVQSIDSMGIGVINVCVNTLKDHGGDLKVQTTNPEFIKLFELLSLNSLLAADDHL